MTSIDRAEGGASEVQRASGLAAAARIARPALLESAERIAEHLDVDVLEPPRAQSIMLELESPVGPFCVGETVVTTCAVAVGDAPGWSCVMGWDAVGALAAAIADAQAVDAGDRLAQAASAREAERRDAERDAIARTRLELS